MSYSDAARSSGPIGGGKIPPVPQVESTGEPHGSIEVVPEEQLKEFQPTIDETKGQIADFSKEVEKQAKANGKKGKDYLSDLFEKIKQNLKVANKKITDIGVCGFNTGKGVGSKAIVEFKNPVVISQAIVGVGAVVAGYFAYLERHRIDTSNKITLGLHGAIITGLVLIDGYLFKKFYPEYK